MTFFPYELKEDDKVALSVISIKMGNTIQAITSDRNTKKFQLSCGIVIVPYRLDILDIHSEKFNSLTERQKKIFFVFILVVIMGIFVKDMLRNYYLVV